MPEGKRPEASHEKTPQDYAEQISRREFLETAAAGFVVALIAGNAKETMAFVEQAVGAGKEQKSDEPKVSFDIFFHFMILRRTQKGLRKELKKQISIYRNLSDGTEGRLTIFR